MEDRRGAPGPCPEGCTLPEGHAWDDVEHDGTATRYHQFYRSPAGYIVAQQSETWSPLIGGSVLSEPLVYLTDDLAGYLTPQGAGVLALASAAAARACRMADKRWSV